MRHPSRSLTAAVRRALVPLAAAALLLGAASTAGATDAPPDDPTTGSSTTDPTAGPTTAPTPAMEPVPASPEVGEPVRDRGPTVARAVAGEAPVRVLLEGDSITQGFNGDYTWRYRLSREIRRQHAAVDLVGSKHATYVADGYTTSVYADPDFDSDHFATLGSMLEQHVRWVAAEATAQQPDVVVLAAGVNDLRWGRTPEQVAGSLQAWVANLRSVVPGVRIVLSPVLQAADPARPWLPARIAAFDALERTVARQLTTTDSPIVVADTARGWATTTDTWDGLHPTPTGEARIAERVGQTLHTIGVLPAAPPSAGALPWRRDLASTVRVSGTRATLRWDAQSLSRVRVLLTAPGRPERLLPTAWTTGVATVPLDLGGRYSFRLLAERGRMRSTPGPSNSVVLPWSAVPAPAAVGRVRVYPAHVSWTPSARATSYVVATQRPHGRWVTRTTTARSLAVSHVARARVWAVNPTGRSVPRSAHR